MLPMWILISLKVIKVGEEKKKERIKFSVTVNRITKEDKLRYLKGALLVRLSGLSAGL